MTCTDCARSQAHTLLAIFILALAVAAPAAGTTYVPMTDAALADQAPLVVEAHIVASAAAPVAGRPATDYTVRLDRVLKGAPPADPLTVRVPGGVDGNGALYRVWGAPRFLTGDRAILFLAPRQDGTFGVSQLMLGAFVAADSGTGTTARALALRDLSGAVAVGEKTTAGPEASGSARDFDAFADWLAARAAGEKPAASYFVDRPADMPRLAERYSLLEANGTNFRWFNGGGVWYAYEAGVPEMAGGGFTEVQAATAAWTADPGSNLTLSYGGKTSRRAGFTGPDGTNVVLFEDPNNEISGSFDCSSGGVLAIGGFSNVSGTATFGGTSFWRIVEGEVVTQDGAGCFFAGNGGKNGELVFGHEIGHALGLGHSCGDSGTPSCADPVLNDALMRAYAHNDGRGARLGQDDRLAVAYLYGDGGAVCTVPAAPTGLTASAVSSSRIYLTWQDQSSDEEGFAVERRVEGSATFVRIATLPAGSHSFTNSGLAASTTYSYRVRATGCDGDSDAAGPVSARTADEVPSDPPSDPTPPPSDPNPVPSDPSPDPPSDPASDAPTGLEAVVLSSTEVRLDWSWSGTTPQTFHVELRSGALFIEAKTVSGTETGTTITGLRRDTGYAFRVRARTSTGYTGYSNVATADTGDLGSGSKPGALTAAEVACDGTRLRDLLARMAVDAPNLPASVRGTGVNLSFTGSGDFAGIAYTMGTASAPEVHLAFSTNPEETTLLRNPARPQLASVSLTRNELNSDLVGAGHSDRLRVTLDPTLTPGSTAATALLTIDNLSGTPDGTSSAKPGRGLGKLLETCHGPFETDDVHLFRVLSKIVRVNAPAAARLELAIYRDSDPGSYRIDAYGYDASGRALGRISARVTAAWTDGALAAGMLEVLPRCAAGAAESAACTTFSGTAEVRLEEPRYRGEVPGAPEVRVAYAPSKTAEKAVDWSRVLDGSTWRRPPAESAANGAGTAGGALLTEAEMLCDATRLEGLLGRVAVIAPSAGRRGVNLSFTRTGDFSGIAYTVAEGVGGRHLAFSTNPEETTLLRNPARPQLSTVSVSRNDLNSDLTASTASLLRVRLDPRLEPDATITGVLQVDNLSTGNGVPANAKPGRGLGELIAPCHQKLTERDVHLFRVLSKIVRAEASGATVAEIAIYKGRTVSGYRMDAYLLAADGTSLGRIAAELTVEYSADGSLRRGTLEVLPRCSGGATQACTSIDRTAELYLVEPALQGQPRSASSARVASKNGPTRTTVDFAALLGDTTWREGI